MRLHCSFQAVGVDKIYPGVFFFAKGGNANNDPWRGYIFCFVIAFGLCMIARQAQSAKSSRNH